MYIWSLFQLRSKIRAARVAVCFQPHQLLQSSQPSSFFLPVYHECICPFIVISCNLQQPLHGNSTSWHRSTAQILWFFNGEPLQRSIGHGALWGLFMAKACGALCRIQVRRTEKLGWPWQNLAEFGRIWPGISVLLSILATAYLAHYNVLTLEGMCQVQIETVWGMKKG